MHCKSKHPDYASLDEASDLLQAIDLGQQYQLSFWDAMIVQSATYLECMQLLSEDLNHDRTYGIVRVINPFQPA